MKSLLVDYFCREFGAPLDSLAVGLQTIRNMIQELQESVDKDLFDFIQIIDQLFISSTMMSTTINHLILYEKFESRQILFDMQSTTVNKMLSELNQICFREIENTNRTRDYSVNRSSSLLSNRSAVIQIDQIRVFHSIQYILSNILTRSDRNQSISFQFDYINSLITSPKKGIRSYFMGGRLENSSYEQTYLRISIKDEGTKAYEASEIYSMIYPMLLMAFKLMFTM